MYLLIDGTEVTKKEIETAFMTGMAVLIHGRGNNMTTTGLMLDGKHWDNRNQCYSMWEETWTCTPETIEECYQAAFC